MEASILLNFMPLPNSSSCVAFRDLTCALLLRKVGEAHQLHEA
jgi:hypothetical protein